MRSVLTMAKHSLVFLVLLLHGVTSSPFVDMKNFNVDTQAIRNQTKEVISDVGDWVRSVITEIKGVLRANNLYTGETKVVEATTTTTTTLAPTTTTTLAPTPDYGATQEMDRIMMVVELVIPGVVVVVVVVMVAYVRRAFNHRYAVDSSNGSSPQPPSSPAAPEPIASTSHGSRKGGRDGKAKEAYRDAPPCYNEVMAEDSPPPYCDVVTVALVPTP